MKRTSIIVSIFFLIFILGLVSAASGAIWTTRNDCGNETQNVNHYDIGESIYINGDNFNAGEYDWSITGLGGSENSQASCNPGIVVASGSYSVDETGAFCFNAYTIQEGDCKGYKVTFDKKHDNYHVVPEFGVFIGALTILSAMAVFFVIRRR